MKNANFIMDEYLKNYSNDFVNFSSECRREQYWSAEKKTAHQKLALTILLSFGQNVEENNIDQWKKIAHQKLASFLRYSSMNLASLIKNANFMDEYLENYS